MIEIELIAGVILILLLAVLFFVKRITSKGKENQSSEPEPQVTESAAQKKEAVETETQVQEVSPKQTTQSKMHSNIPEDSMLKRHYLTHVRSIVEAAKGARPTDSALKRHYDTMIDSEVEQYLDAGHCC